MLPECIFSALKIALRIEQKTVKTWKIANILETAGNIVKSPKFLFRDNLKVYYKKWLLILNYVLKKKYFWFQMERYFWGSKNEYQQQVWGLGIFPYTFLAVLKNFKKIWGGQ